MPVDHAPNQGFLRAVAVLAKASGSIGEIDEAARCRQLLDDSDPKAAAALGVDLRAGVRRASGGLAQRPVDDGGRADVDHERCGIGHRL